MYLSLYAKKISLSLSLSLSFSFFLSAFTVLLLLSSASGSADLFSVPSNLTMMYCFMRQFSNLMRSIEASNLVGGEGIVVFPASCRLIGNLDEAYVKSSRQYRGRLKSIARCKRITIPDNRIPRSHISCWRYLRYLLA